MMPPPLCTALMLVVPPCEGHGQVTVSDCLDKVDTAHTAPPVQSRVLPHVAVEEGPGEGPGFRVALRLEGRV